MMAFPSMLTGAAQKANMKVPADPDDFDPNEYSHFYVYCQLQLGRAIHWGEHWENARVIAKIPVDKLKKMTLEDFINAGLQWQS